MTGEKKKKKKRVILMQMIPGGSSFLLNVFVILDLLYTVECKSPLLEFLNFSLFFSYYIIL